MSAEQPIHRRQFLGATGRSVGGALAFSAASCATPSNHVSPSSRVLGANEKVRLGVIGCGFRASQLIHLFNQFDDCVFTAVCDVDKVRLAEAQERTGGKAKMFDDYRKLLEQNDVDAVVVATNGHWHVLPAVHACQAGKDVYVEKPLSLVPREGRALVTAAERYNRLVAVGTQQHSREHYRHAAELIQEGAIGKVTMCESFNVENRDPRMYAESPITNPPDSLDWDFWLGPAPKAPYHINRIRAHYFYWATAGGWQSDWAVHHHDLVHWFMQVKGPNTVVASGGKYWMKDDTDVPDTLDCVYEYDDFVSIYRVRFANAAKIMGMDYGNIFYGTKGTLKINRGGMEVIPESGQTEVVTGHSDELGQHQRNFIDCLKSRKTPNAGILTGHRASVPGELANISYRVGRKLRWDVENDRILGDREANAMCDPNYRKPWVLPT